MRGDRRSRVPGRVAARGAAMSVTYCAGDLFTVDAPPALAHGCNCAGAMGKGIAVTFKQKWPRMYQQYKALCASGQFGLGDVFAWEEGGTVVYNLGTQRTWRSGAELEAVRTALARLHGMLDEAGIDKLYLPRIASGLGGLDWEAVKALIESMFASSRVHVFVCEDFIAGSPLRCPGAAQA
jgi:O-acetyl-ADP-ribose deacetylase (regulator of RNase III)